MTGTRSPDVPALGIAGEFRNAQRWVAPFMVIGAAALVLGLWAGLVRMGWDMPEADTSLPMRHGGLMVVGFVVTVIAVERAVAVRSLPAFAAPALSAATGLLLITNLSVSTAPALALGAAVAYSINVAILLYRHRQPPFVLSLLGALALGGGGVVWWRGDGISNVAPWWITFLVLTIAAERLEILRFARFTAAEVVAGAVVLTFALGGAAVSLANDNVGLKLLGAGLAGLAIWLLRRDVARRTIRTDGLARYAATGVLAAYGWLIAGGLLLIAWGLRGGGYEYDAVMHAFFVGFVLSAIMAHAPIIIPAVTGLRVSYTPLFYIPLVLLNATLLLRVGADVLEAADARRWAGMLQAISILLFLGITAGTLLLNRRQRLPRGAATAG